MSCDLRKSEVEEREKSARSWCHNYIFCMSLSLLLVSNDINHRRNFKGKSRVTRCKNSKSRMVYYGIFWSGQLGSITGHGKPLCHPERIIWKEWSLIALTFSGGQLLYNILQTWQSSLFCHFLRK